MDILQKIIARQGNNVTSIDLEFKQIDNLEDLLPQLANFVDLRELNLHGNRLTHLPDDLSLLDTVEVLDVSNNMFADLAQVAEALATLPSLQHLHIGLSSKEEEQYIIDSLPNLITLNQQPVRNDSNFESQSEHQSERSIVGQEITLQQEDLEQMAILFDNIRELQKEQDEEAEKTVQAQFDNHVRTIMKDLQTKLGKQQPDHLTNLSILKAKYNLYEVCFKQLIKYFKNVDKKIESIVVRLHDQHLTIFTDITAVITNFKEPTQILQADAPQRRQSDLSVDRGLEQRLRQELQELQQYNKELESENKKYLETILKHSKGEKVQFQAMDSQPRQHMDSYATIERKVSSNKQMAQMSSLVNPQSVRSLTLKQLKDVINEIYESKQKYDQKFLEAKLPRETMELHMYTYLNQKYGLKNLIIEWATSIINAIKKYAGDDNDIAVFGKILRNECDEEFRFVQTQVKNTMQELLKMYLRGKYPLKHQAEIKEMLNQRISGFIFEEEAVDIIKYMYNQEDSELLLNKLKQYYVPQTKQIEKRLTREEQIQIMGEKDKMKLDYNIFQKIILDFQLKSHEKYLKKFIFTFKQMDSDQNGMMDENEFRQLVGMLNFGVSDIEIQKYLNIVDPYSHQQITFSQCVTLFSSETIPNSNGQISILQKISEQ